MAWVARLGAWSADRARRLFPDPFVIAILLGAFVLVLGTLLGHQGPLVLCEAYLKGVMEPALLAFAFQMALILVTGHALASTPLVRRGLAKLADLPTSASGAAALVAAASMTMGWLNWGLGLISGAFLAREVGRSFQRRGLSLNYPLVGAAGYMGLLIWHGGLSASAPLKVAQDGPYGPALDVQTTLFSSLNLVVCFGLLVVVPLIFWAMAKGAPAEEPTPAYGASPQQAGPALDAAVPWIEASAWVSAALVLPLLVALLVSFQRLGSAALNLPAIIVSFWLAGLVLHRSPARYGRAFADGVPGASGILLQFPIYFGILAVTREAGLLPVFADGMSALSVQLSPWLAAELTAPLGTFLVASGVNLLVPSGGGQWVLQSPVILETVQTFDLARPTMVMAFAYGDQWTNMLQPFWALPLLSITGLRARDIMGYTMVAMIGALPIFVVGLALLG